MLSKEEKEKLETGDTCPECKKGKIALMAAFVNYAEKDSEPYKADIIEGHQEEVQLNDNIRVSIHACDECGEIIRRWFDDDFLGFEATDNKGDQN